MQRYADLYEIDAVCLSHLHADHCLEVCDYSVARTFHPDGPKPRMPVYGPAEAEVRLGRALAADPAVQDARPDPDPGDGITDAFSFATITPGVMEIGPLRITAARMNHPVETFGFRLEHAGRSLAYSADTGPTEALVGAGPRRRRAALRGVVRRAADAAAAAALPEDLHLTGRQAGAARRAGRRRPARAHPPGAVERRGQDAGRGGPGLQPGRCPWPHQGWASCSTEHGS